MENMETPPRMRLVAEAQMIYKKIAITGSKPMSDSKKLYELLIRYWNMETIEWQETFKVLLLNGRRRVLGIFELSKSTMATIAAYPDFLLFCVPGIPVRSMVIAHNSPTGSLFPKEADLALAEKFVTFCKGDRITLQDHLIISRQGYFSFRDKGFLANGICGKR